MGKEYILGLASGFRLSASENCKKHRQKFGKKAHLRCLYVEVLLLFNMFRLFA
jgi:hypothetical protein